MRALLIGGGTAGLALAGSLVSEGHAVRFVTRRPERASEVEACGAECWIGDPDRIGTLRYALDNVTVLLWLLGGVDDPDLHGSRLQMMMERTIDTTVRGIVYEQPPELTSGTEIVRRMAGYNEIPYALVAAGRSDRDRWVAAVRDAIDGLLAAERAGHDTRSV